MVGYIYIYIGRRKGVTVWRELLETERQTFPF